MSSTVKLCEILINGLERDRENIKATIMGKIHTPEEYHMCVGKVQMCDKIIGDLEDIRKRLMRADDDELTPEDN